MKLSSALIRISLVLGIEINGVRREICLNTVYENKFKKRDRTGAVDRVLEDQ